MGRSRRSGGSQALQDELAGTGRRLIFNLVSVAQGFGRSVRRGFGAGVHDPERAGVIDALADAGQTGEAARRVAGFFSPGPPAAKRHDGDANIARSDETPPRRASAAGRDG